MNSLLIGNGLNLTNKENNFLNTKEIASRFKDNLSIYWNVIEKLIYKDKLDISEILKRLDKNKGIILAENNYLPVDKRGNVNVLVVGRFRFW